MRMKWTNTRTIRSVSIFDLGKKSMYAPRTPEIAPLAPITGIVEWEFKVTWINTATSPQTR